jgi:hypothetical protein
MRNHLETMFARTVADWVGHLCLGRVDKTWESAGG